MDIFPLKFSVELIQQSKENELWCKLCWAKLAYHTLTTTVLCHAESGPPSTNQPSMNAYVTRKSELDDCRAFVESEDILSLMAFV